MQPDNPFFVSGSGDGPTHQDCDDDLLPQEPHITPECCLSDLEEDEITIRPTRQQKRKKKEPNLPKKKSKTAERRKNPIRSRRNKELLSDQDLYIEDRHRAENYGINLHVPLFPNPNSKT